MWPRWKMLMKKWFYCVIQSHEDLIFILHSKPDPDLILPPIFSEKYNIVTCEAHFSFSGKYSSWFYHLSTVIAHYWAMLKLLTALRCVNCFGVNNFSKLLSLLLRGIILKCQWNHWRKNKSRQWLAMLPDLLATGRGTGLDNMDMVGHGATENKK